MKKTLGLDLGTNSIGWAIINSSVNEDGNEKFINISSTGSRIIPMDAATLGDFDKGNSKSQTSERTGFRGTRRLRERSLLRRERLLRVLHCMNFLPEHYASQITRYGKFTAGTEPKLAWYKDTEGKYSFLFKDSFNEMLHEFQQSNPDFLESGKKNPYDWTLYYLRKKALTTSITKEELAWVLLNFNQKRGYYQLRGEEEQEDNKKCAKYYALKVLSVEDSGDRKGKDIWYNIHLENGFLYRKASSTPLDWEGQTKDFIITTELDDSGNTKRDKDGNEKYSIRAPKEDDWGLLKAKTQESIDESGKTVGAYIYDVLLQNPTQKIKGKLVRTIERIYYKNELIKILETQSNFHPELKDQTLLTRCVEELYPCNESHRNVLLNSTFIHFLIEDILFYQRPLKSKKNLIDNCPYEVRVYKKSDGTLEHQSLKCTSKSHPLFQEFRLWQFISNLRIYQREKMVGDSFKTDVDVTSDFLKDEESYVSLFEWLNEKKEISQKTLLAYKPFNINKKELPGYRWNYVEDKIYPCNETRAALTSRLEKAKIDKKCLTKKLEEDLWHLLYSISDKQELQKALHRFAEKNQLGDCFVEAFSNMPPFANDFAAYSLKAISRLLPLMRMGKYWDAQSIDASTLCRIGKLLTGEYDEEMHNRVREKAVHLTDFHSFKGLPLWLACYIVYDRHSEIKDVNKWTSPKDIDRYLQNFKQHSLRNPIVEQVVTETLRVVRDIWKKEGQIDEIHIELGREMKKTAKEREQLSKQSLENEYTNLRIKALLAEFQNQDFEIENVRPYSPSQQEILRIYEDGVLSNPEDVPEDIAKILKKFKESDIKKQPTHAEILKYKLWLDQKYRSPYTGRIIPLGKLFTNAYEIEHVIPQSRYFDDSYTNKVICESAVNKLKDNSLGYEFIKQHHGEIVDLGNGEKTAILEVGEYEEFIKKTYSNNSAKMKKLLLEDIPEGFIERQLNDSRYISKLIKGLLSNIVREEGEQEAISKNVIVCTGGITDRLKKDWGIQDVWNRIILPRFMRLNELVETSDFTSVSAGGHLIPTMPLYLQKGFNKKRIDHRHHAMDAIVIACATRNIVNYLNNASARKDSKITRHDLQRLLCDKKETDDKGNYRWIVRKPWETFTQDVYMALTEIVVSFKQNLRVINRTTNYFQHYNEEGKKVLVPQTKGDSWAIRKPMHKDTVYGEVNLRKIKTVALKDALNSLHRIVDKTLKHQLVKLVQANYDIKAINNYFDTHKNEWPDLNLKKIEIYYFTKETKDSYFAIRKSLDTEFNSNDTGNNILEKILNHIEDITDTGIQKILLKHLQDSGNKAEIAFSPDGIRRMNQNIQALNNGKQHQPIMKARFYERANKFAIGTNGNKESKFVEAAKGTNLFYAVYESLKTDKESGKEIKTRSYASIPLNIVIDRMKKGLPPAPEDASGNLPAFVLSPNDLVYLPTDEERITNQIKQPLNKERIYKMVSCTGNQCFFIQATVANVIWDKKEYSSMNKMEKAISNEMIKETCIPLEIDRLGNIKFK